jgi:hypothetical protein
VTRAGAFAFFTFVAGSQRAGRPLAGDLHASAPVSLLAIGEAG